MSRVFNIQSPTLHGSDIEAWQQDLLGRFHKWDIDYELDVDGYYGKDTRAATKSFMHAWGVKDTDAALKDGLTPEWRTKLRHDNRSVDEEQRFRSAALLQYRQDLRDNFSPSVAMPVKTDLAKDTNGWTGMNGHDGIDLLCDPNAPLYAVCKSKVVRVAADGWWGNNPQPSGGHQISEGDGIIILEALEDLGPIRKGMHFGYGHAEHATVKVGDIVDAGDKIGLAGFARAWHSHWMINVIPAKNGFYTGRGDQNPRPILDYLEANS